MERSRIELTGPLAAHVSGFQAELRRLGYTASPAKKHHYLLAHLSRWLDEQGLDVADVATPRVAPFFVARRAAGVANLRTRASLAPLVAYLRGQDVLPAAEVPAPASGAERIIEGFRTYLTRERGLVEGTVRFYVHIARLLVNDRATGDGAALSSLSAHDVTAFTTQVCECRGLSSCRQAVSALRSFLRFLALEGVTMALDDAVLAVAGWNPSLPRAISLEDVARLLASCDRRRAIGRRDFAILLLLARLGLRGGEVVAMELGDIDWRAGEVTVRGKGRRQERLPLPADVGEALAAYLQRGRPASESRRLFLRRVAPFVGFAGTGALRGVLERACKRAGLPYVSPHRLRHTTATEMLRAGAGLAEIGQVLRHRSAVTTATYAKVDHAQLRMIARPWPGSAS